MSNTNQLTAEIKTKSIFKTTSFDGSTFISRIFKEALLVAGVSRSIEQHEVNQDGTTNLKRIYPAMCPIK